MAILLLVFRPQLQLLLVVIGRAHSLGIARPTLRLLSLFPKAKFALFRKPFATPRD
jgi:hypothetical protein